MKIKDSKNLKYDLTPRRGPLEGYEKFEPRICFLDNFKRINDTLYLYFKNGSQATISAKNIEGGREMDLIADKFNYFLEKTYEDILNADF